MHPVSTTPSFISSTPKETGRTRRFALEGLEPRWLLSATPVAAALQAAFPVQEPEPLWQEAVQPAQASATVAASGQLNLSQDTASQGVPGAWASAPLGAAPASVWLSSSLGNPVGDARLQSVYGQARSAVQAFLSQTHALDLQALFPGDGSDALVLLHTEAVRQDWLQGAGSVTLTLASSEQLGGAMAAFTANGPSGGAEVFVNRQWLNGLATDADLLRVLVEELGHGLDAALNGERDSLGDEGELFAAHVLALPLEPSQRQRIALEDDHALLWWGMNSVTVEQASFSIDASISDGRVQDASNTITGNVTLTSTETAVGGRLLVGSGTTTYDDPTSFLNGDSLAGNDTLTIKASGAVRFYAAIGLTDPLEGLTITASSVTPTGLPSAVIFEQDVVLAGPLIIDTDGVVSFTGKVTITNGSLQIRGASEIYFNQPVDVNGGSILLEANEIELKGNATLKSQGGSLTMRSTTLNLGMEVGSPSQINLAKLDLSAAELEAMAGGGFSKVILGHVDSIGPNTGHATAGQGQVRISGAKGPNQFTFHAPLEVYGDTIRIEDIENESDPGLAIKGTVLLDATGNIEIRNRLVGSTDLSQDSALQDITLYSSGGWVKQTNENALGFSDSLNNEPLQGDDLTVRALTGIDLIATEVNTATLTNAGTGHIRLIETAVGGALTLKQAQITDTTNTSGVVSVQTLSSTDGNLTLALAAVGHLSAPGSVSLRAGAALTLGANADLVQPDGADAGTDPDLMGGTIDLQAGTAMVLTGRTLKAVSDIRVQAGTSLAVGKIQSSGKVALIAGGSITDGDSDTLADVTASGLLVQAGAAGGVGTSANALETNVSTFNGLVGSGGLFLLEADSLSVGSLSRFSASATCRRRPPWLGV
jgi:hypothetical protein